MKESFEEFGAVASLDVLGALAALGRAKTSGTARFLGPAGEEILYGFDGGFLVALGTPEENAPAHVLIRSGKLQPVTFESLAIGDGEDRFAVAVASGVVSRREAAWGLKMSAIESLVRVLSWTEGSYAFDEGAPSPTEPALRLGIDPWILELFLRSSDRGFVLRRAGATDIPVARASSFGPRFSALGLTADADAVVEAIDGTRSIEQIVKRSRADEFATLKLLAALTTLGLIHPVLEAPLEIAPAAIAPEAAPEPGAVASTSSPVEPAPFPAWEPEAPPEIAAESEPLPVASEDRPDEAPLPARWEEPAADFPAWEPEPATAEIQSAPMAVDPMVEAEAGADRADAEVEVPEAAGGPEVEPVPPVSLRELPSLPLFALTAPEPGGSSSPEEVPLPDATSEGEPAAVPPPSAGRGWIWGAAAAGIAVLAGALFLRSRVSSPPGPAPSAPERAETVLAPARSDTAASSPPLTARGDGPRTAPSLRAPSSGDRPVAAPTPPAAIDRPTPAPARPRTDSRPPKPAAVSPRREPASPPREDGRWRDLAEKGRRWSDRPGRLRYAIQLELACETGTLEKAFAQDTPSHAIWIAPYAFRGRSCYRVLFGRYADLAGAKAARSSVPALFTREGNRPTVVSLGAPRPAPVKKRRARR